MEHKVSLNEISDGKLYTLNDMVKLGCDGCNGAASCCRFAADTITLDPYDLYQLTEGTGLFFDELYAKQLIALSPVDGLLLPHLNLSGEKGSCTFLTETGTCNIHTHRPGLCRLFPLARYFEGNTIHYILQLHECPNKITPKIKIKKWLGISNAEQYESFLIHWNRILTDTRTTLSRAKNNTELSSVTTVFLKTFYVTRYETETDFYKQFEERAMNFFICS